jgi:hypothetical protein
MPYRSLSPRRVTAGRTAEVLNRAAARGDRPAHPRIGRTDSSPVMTGTGTGLSLALPEKLRKVRRSVLLASRDIGG